VQLAVRLCRDLPGNRDAITGFFRLQLAGKDALDIADIGAGLIAIADSDRLLLSETLEAHVGNAHFASLQIAFVARRSIGVFA
jgi:hypothetical protein